MEENIGCRISRLRKAQDIGVYQLAEQARVSAQTVYRWEHGNVANIKESILERFAYTGCYEILYKNRITRRCIAA